MAVYGSLGRNDEANDVNKRIAILCPQAKEPKKDGATKRASVDLGHFKLKGFPKPNEK